MAAREAAGFVACSVILVETLEETTARKGLSAFAPGRGICATSGVFRYLVLYIIIK